MHRTPVIACWFSSEQIKHSSSIYVSAEGFPEIVFVTSVFRQIYILIASKLNVLEDYKYVRLSTYLLQK